MSIGITKTFNLDMVPGGAPPVIHVSAGDVGRPFRANLLYSGETYGLDAVTSVKIRGTKPDKTVFEYDLTFDTEDSHVDFIIEEQMAIIAGPVLCEIRLFSGEDTIGSANFILDVETAVYDPEAASESYIPSFETAIQEALENVADDIADLATAAAINDVKQYSDAASASATAAAGSATSAQTSAGTATASAEDAEDAADRAEEAADSIMVNDYDRTPYKLRPSGGGMDIGSREYDTVVGGTVAWNQKIKNGNFANGTTNWGTSSDNTVAASDGVLTLTPGRKYASITQQMSGWVEGHAILMSFQIKSTIATPFRVYSGAVWSGFTKDVPADTWTTLAGVNRVASTAASSAIYIQNNYNADSGWGVQQIKSVQMFDLTQMFGSTIADYIYSLEQATAGAGVAWFRQYFPEDYYVYNAGEVLSVSGVSAHVMRDSNDNIIGNYPLDDSLTLRGIPKLDGGNLYYDGDTYKSDGTVTRKYGIVDLGTLTNWTRGKLGGSEQYYFYVAVNTLETGKPSYNNNLVCAKYPQQKTLNWLTFPDKHIAIGNSEAVPVLYIRDDAYTDTATFKTAMSGVYLVYKLATQTTETADPFTNPQVVDPDGTEQYVTTSIVPVGHDTRYPYNIANKVNQILEAPSTNGTYTLKCTVSNGEVTYFWQ